MRERITVGLVVAVLLAVPAVAQGPGGPGERGQGRQGRDRHGQAKGPGPHQCRMGAAGQDVESSGPLSDTGLEALGLALQDEYRAEGLYRQVLEQLGDVRPFAHIVYAEQRHSAALERVYSRRGLVAPGSQWQDLGQELQGETLQEACQAAVEAERDNVSLYDELLGRDLPADVVGVFEHLRGASLDRHLPAFERCATGVGAHGSQGKMAGGCCGRCEKRGAKGAGR